MSAYTCPLCGDVMAAEFADVHYMPANVEQRLIDIFAELFPHWRAEDGACPNCIDLFRAYRKTFIRPLGLGLRLSPEDVSLRVILCTLCGYEIPKEDFLFHQRVEESIFDRIRKHKPSWVKDYGEWPGCVTYLANIVSAAIDQGSDSDGEDA